MNAEPAVLSENRGRVALLTLNQPRTFNALSDALMSALVDALKSADADPEVFVIVITGSDKAFCAGANLVEFVPLMETNAMQDRAVDLLLRQLDATRKPVVAAVRGLALGGGCELALACDTIVIAESAKIGVPEVSLAVMPGAGGTIRLVHAVGKAKAMKMILTGVPVDAATAVADGIACEQAPDEDCVDRAIALAEKMAKNGPLAIRLAKDSAKRAFDMPLPTAVEHERSNFFAAMHTDDCHEGVAAFNEKRKPSFTGK
ncbi:MAG TPA: enoyl-CoA hydratase-related protein [Dermatophilaceae bacterium]|nr:enoyl-CoA hydratase-related protein [Dermatophilaceae bacterium]